MNNTLNISVIIPTLSRSESVRRLLDSLARQSRMPEQILIIDASEDHDTEAVIHEVESVIKAKLEYYRTARGLTRQRNFGLQKATGDIIGFFDDDVILETNYIAEIIRPFESNPDTTLGGVTGYIYPKAERGFLLLKAYIGLKAYLQSGPCLAKYYNLNLIPKQRFTGNIPVRYTHGCNMIFRRVVFDTIRFDEWFEGYGLGEDKDFSLRVARSWRILAVGAARLHHLHEPAGRPNYMQIGKMCLENHVRVLTVARDDHVLANALGLMMRQMSGIALTTIAYLVNGRFRNAFDIFLGGLSGVPAALHQLNRKRT